MSKNWIKITNDDLKIFITSVTSFPIYLLSIIALSYILYVSAFFPDKIISIHNEYNSKKMYSIINYDILLYTESLSKASGDYKL